jgi:predicted nuclease with TOPRIM domain
MYLQVAAAEAAMALRDHIIKQLVTALQQKKAEVKALREQQAALQRQLEAAEGEGVASKQKLRELAEGIQVRKHCFLFKQLRCAMLCIACILYAPF